VEKSCCDLDLIVLAPGQGTGFLRQGQTEESHRKHIGLNNDKPGYSFDSMTPPVSAKGMVEILFTVGSFIPGDYFIPHLHSLQVVYSSQTHQSSCKDKVYYPSTLIGYHSFGMQHIINDRVKGKDIPQVKPKMILTRGSTVTKQEMGQYQSITNAFSPDAAYAPHQVIALLRLDPTKSKNWSLLDHFSKYAKPIWQMEADIYDTRF
jgi:hypothetical protein